MRISEAISTVDSIKPNGYDNATKKYWLSQLDWQIKREIIDRSTNEIEYNGYDEDVSEDTELLVPAPYDDIYVMYLKAQIDLENGEVSKYNNDIALFNAAYDVYAKYYRRNNYPKGKTKFKYYGG